MDDEPKKPADDIQGILSDLDDILSGIGGAAPPAPPAAPKPVEPPKPIEQPKPVEAAKPVEPPKPAEAPKLQTPAPADDMKIELASREGSLTPAKKPDAPKPAAAPKPLASDSKPPLEIPIEPAAAPAPAPKAAEPPKPIVPPAPAVPVPKAAAPVEPAKPAAPAVPSGPATAAGEEIPAGTPKDQIRRVAYVHTFACAEARASFAAFLSQAARTISKKPLFLRQVLTLEVDTSSDPNAIFEKARAVKAAAIIAIVDGWPPAKVEALSEACSRGGMQFRVVAPGDVLKKSTAVDVIVDMMLLPGEA